jgi:hypothetical protein
MRTLARTAALALLLLPSGCSATSRQLVPFPPQDVAVTRGDLTRIYLLREGWIGIDERPVKVFDDATEIGEVTSDTYLCWERSPGRTLGRVLYYSTVVVGDVEGVADFDCAAGTAYYFKVTVAREGGKPEVHPLDPEEGRKLVAERKPAHAG